MVDILICVRIRIERCKLMGQQIIVPKHIEYFLNNIDLIPLTENNFFDGIPGKLFIIGLEDRNDLGELISIFERVPEQEWRAWDDERKIYYSRILHCAERVYAQCVVIPQVSSVLQRVAVKHKIEF